LHKGALLPVAQRLVTETGGINQLFTALPLQPPILALDRGNQGSMAVAATLQQQ